MTIALQTGWLSLENENRLRQLMGQPYGREDFRAIVALQRAAMEQRVLQESRQRLMVQMHLRSMDSRAMDSRAMDARVSDRRVEQYSAIT